MTRQRLINQTMLFGLVMILVAGCGTPVSPSSTAAKTDERPSDQRETIGAPAEDTAKQTEKASTPEEVTLYLPGMNLKLKIL